MKSFQKCVTLESNNESAADLLPLQMPVSHNITSSIIVSEPIAVLQINLIKIWSRVAKCPINEIPMREINAQQFLHLISKLHVILNSQLENQDVSQFIKPAFCLRDLQNYITCVLLKDYSVIEPTIKLFASLLDSTHSDINKVRPLSILISKFKRPKSSKIIPMNFQQTQPRMPNFQFPDYFSTPGSNAPRKTVQRMLSAKPKADRIRPSSVNEFHRESPLMAKTLVKSDVRLVRYKKSILNDQERTDSGLIKIHKKITNFKIPVHEPTMEAVRTRYTKVPRDASAPKRSFMKTFYFFTRK